MSPSIFSLPVMKAEGADIVIAIPHSGIATLERRGMDENVIYYLSTVPDVNAILFGHRTKECIQDVRIF